MTKIQQDAIDKEMQIKNEHQKNLMDMNTKMLELAQSVKENSDKMKLESFQAAINAMETMQKQLDGISTKVGSPQVPQVFNIHLPNQNKKLVKTKDGFQTMDVNPEGSLQ